MLTCAELIKLVTDYVEGALPAEERRRFEEHLAICPPCRGYLAQMRRTKELLGRLREEDMPPAVQDDLVQVFRDWRPD